MLVDSSKFEITGAPDSTYLAFFEDDLDMLMLYFDTARIGLFTAKCFTTTNHSSGTVHNIAVGIKSDGTLSTSGRAALPCPPDCGEKGSATSSDTITLTEYKFEGLAKFVSPEFSMDFRDEIFELIEKYKRKKRT